MKTKTTPLIFSIFFILYIGTSCHYTDTTVISSTEFSLPADSGTIYRLKKRYFILEPGDTATLYGTRSCTSFVNGTIDSIVTNDSLYYRTITKKKETLVINDTTHLVYPQIYQEAGKTSELNRSSITRFFKKDNLAILQLAYKKENKITYIDKNKQWVIPIILEVGPYGWFQSDSTTIPVNNTWRNAPLIPLPLTGATNRFFFESHSVASQPISLPNSGENQYIINGVAYNNGVFIKTYYSMSGEFEEQGSIVRVVGSVMITRTYFTDRGLVDQLRKTFIQKFYHTGTVKTYKEESYIARGPEGAKVYPEYDTIPPNP